MAVGLWLTATAANTVTLTSVQGHPGDEVEIAVMLTITDEVTAIELLVPLGDKLSYVEGSAVINAERANGHTLSAAEQDGKLSMVIFSPTLAPLKGVDGELCRFKVKLGKEPADYPLVPEVVMSDASGKAIASSVESGVVTLLSPTIEVTTPTIDYGRVPIRSTYTQTLSVKNVGNEPLEITGIAFDHSDLTASPTPCTIAAGSTQDFTLTYAPLQRGTVTSNVTITSNAINPKVGKAVVTAHPFSVNELHVQRVEGISDEEVTVVLKMNNMEPIAGAQCEFTLPDALKYVEGSAAVGGRCEATDHKVSGVVQGKVLTLFMYSPTNKALPEGDGELITFRVRLDGQSGSYRLDPKEVVLSNIAMENMTSATSGNYVVVKSPKFSGANALDMGDIPVTLQSTATYSIYNSSQVPLAINKVTFLAEGYTIEEELPLIIEPWQTKTLTVAYTPTTEGACKTTMQVYTNDPTNRMHSVAVSSKVYEPNHITVSGDNTQDGYRFAFAMDNYTEIVAIQMNLKWLPGMSASTATLTPTNRLKNHAYLVTNMGNGAYQVLIYSMANIPIEGNSGELFAIDYAAAEGTSYQNTELCVTDIVLSDAKGNNYVSGDEVKAKAAFSNFTLRFVVEGETISEQFVKQGTAITAPEMPSREGHSFVWTGLSETMPSNNLTVTGTYTVNNYSVIYKVDGEVYKTESIAYGIELVAIEAPTKEGHTFSGWSELPETMPAGDIVITGSFTVNSYSVIYKVDGEVYRTEEVAYGSKVILVDDPTKEGHTFSGWRKEGNAESESPMWKEIDIANNADAMLYTNAPCTNTTYGDQFQGWHVLFDNNPNTIFHSEYNRVESADGLDHYLRVDMGENKTVGKFTFTYTVRGNDASYTPSRIVVEGANEPNGDYTEIAELTNLPRNMGAVYESDILGKDDEGYRYIRYRVTETFNNAKVYNHPYFYFAEFGMAGCVENCYIMPARDLVFEGYYTKNRYLVTFKVDDEVIVADSIEYGAEIVIPEPPYREGYTFGWSELPETMPAEDLVVSGYFTINTYKVYYYVGEELVHAAEVPYGEKIPEYIYEPQEGEGEFLSWMGDDYETMPAHEVYFSAELGEIDTDIHQLLQDGGKLVIYDLQGRKIQVGGLHELTTGVYIINGKKVVIK